MNIRSKLHLIADGPRVLKPHACYTFTSDEWKDFCQFLKFVRYPNGYTSNILRNVNVNEDKISWLKRHDCHMLL